MVSEYRLGRPAAPLRAHISHYGGYRSAGEAPQLHRGLPSPHLTLIFTLDDPLLVLQHVDQTTAPTGYLSMIGGLHTSPALITHDGWQSGVQVSLHPLGARALLGLPAGELAGLDFDAEALLGPLVGRVRERLLLAGTWAQRFAVLDEVFLARLDERTAPAPEVRHAWRRILGAGGDLPVATLAEEVGWSARHLTGRFTTELGLSPKVAARVVRFDRARRSLVLRRGTIAEAAAAHGYYDQSHLVRDFRAFAGCTPTTWLAEEFRIVQAPLAQQAAGSPA
ncbi:AraC family transcriptional regulator [Actinokineospora bangkokensis]|uniref:AraC family transcriptional regulator n=1 Tax=Actinokineospora bangkokensis TaxID=1193682 RepID=A0A1Q9LLU7_9PSEU|nr:helix-turn-helix domain-containing protein [Actinokineospora bangkokensis]OLR93008.1 AraC family transcriptional regulator [Actinokineospora bangkokensis]